MKIRGSCSVCDLNGLSRRCDLATMLSYGSCYKQDLDVSICDEAIVSVPHEDPLVLSNNEIIN